ncbi:hypothetical protein BFINE_57830 [Bacteroides finegoldii DSM 17565]|nr:hypothetical protein BFINE_57830 [Bacteroides finegoldii DSM 17565]
MIIVVVILMIAMGFKSGVIIGISLVVTVFGSFLFLYFMDGTMQRVSLASFVLAMGCWWIMRLLSSTVFW